MQNFLSTYATKKKLVSLGVSKILLLWLLRFSKGLKQKGGGGGGGMV